MEFKFIEDTTNRIMFQSAYDVINNGNYWEQLRNFTPQQNTGFAWSNDKLILELKTKISDAYPQHSGASMAFILRAMWNIAHDGLESFKRKFQ
jgi:hypothetical protein